jgi:hypothetical protein
MMENRSFDHFLGWLGSDTDYLDAGRRRYGKTFSVAARTNLRYRDPQGDLVPTESIDRSPRTRCVPRVRAQDPGPHVGSEPRPARSRIPRQGK